MDDKVKIAEIITTLNQAVAKSDLSNLDMCFHENIKIIAHNLKILGDGKSVCIQSYIDFIKKAKIIQYTDRIDNVFVYENTAIVFYTYTMTWLMDGDSFTESGKELYVLTKENDKWLIILRKLIAAHT